MPVDLSIKQVDDQVAERLRARAKRNHRSLQGELKAILEEAAGGARLTVQDIVERNRARGFSTPSTSVEIIREMREERGKHLEEVLEQARSRHARRR